MPSQARSFPSLSFALLLFLAWTNVSSTTGSVSLYTIHHNTDVDNVTVMTTQNVLSSLACVVLCSKHDTCKAFHAQNLQGSSPTTERRKWRCSLLGGLVSGTQLQAGQGTYGYKLIPPNLPGGVPTEMRWSQYGLEAVYDCSGSSSGLTNVAILYDDKKNEWPTLSTACATSLCLQSGLAGSLLQLQANSTHVSAHVTCLPGETKVGDASCDLTGLWYLPEPYQVVCTSGECFRSNRFGRSLYTGTQAVSKNDIECQRWDKTSPNFHFWVSSFFWLDNKDRRNAQNFCRDPSGDGAPWCLQTSGGRWAFCGIPRCRR